MLIQILFRLALFMALTLLTSCAKELRSVQTGHHTDSPSDPPIGPSAPQYDGEHVRPKRP